MTWIALITAVIKAITMGLWTWLERDKRRKKLKKQAHEELKNGIKERDPAKVTAAFDKYRRIG